MRAIALDGPLVVPMRPPHEYLERSDPLYGMANSTAGGQPVPFWFGAGGNQTMNAGLRVSREAIRDGMTVGRALHW
jgi:hypothetical protein